MRWLKRELNYGLKALVVLRLEGGIGEGEIDKMAMIWYEAFSQKVSDELLDAPRVRDGFHRIFPSIRKWPTPAQVIDLMPRRKPLLQLPHILTSEQRQQNRERAREMIRLLSEESK